MKADQETVNYHLRIRMADAGYRATLEAAAIQFEDATVQDGPKPHRTHTPLPDSAKLE
jgi:hypothetical protein